MQTPRDDNNVPAMQGTLNTDGKTLVPIKVNPANHALKVSNGTTGSSFPATSAGRDDNNVPAIWGVSAADGITLIPIYADASGNLLIKST